MARRNAVPFSPAVRRTPVSANYRSSSRQLPAQRKFVRSPKAPRNPFRHSTEPMTLNGLVVRVKILAINGEPSQQKLTESPPQTIGVEPPGAEDSIAGTLLLESIPQLAADGNSSESQSARGVLLIAPSQRGSPALPASLNNSAVGPGAPDAKEDPSAKTTPAPGSKTSLKPVRHIPIKFARKVILLKVESIDWIRANHNHVSLQVGKQSHVLRGTLDSFEHKLPPEKFVRISRSEIVQIDRIKELDLRGSGDCRIHLEDGTSLNLSRRYRTKLHEIGLL